MRQFYVYILTSRSGVLYVGMTNDLERRVYEHKQKRVPGFTARYNVNLLVFYEAFPQPMQAIAAEKKIKGWTRAKKITLIESKNPTWKDLSEDWYVPEVARAPVRHPERSEGSREPRAVLPPEILRCAQDDEGCARMEVVARSEQRRDGT